MSLETADFNRISERARLGTREIEVFRLTLERLDDSAIAERMGIKETTVRSHRSHLVKKILKADLRDRRWKEVSELLFEVIPGPTVGSPRTPLYRELAEGEGEIVRLNSQIVTVEDVLGQDGKIVR
jgi:hypothetical protein